MHPECRAEIAPVAQRISLDHESLAYPPGQCPVQRGADVPPELLRSSRVVGEPISPFGDNRPFDLDDLDKNLH